MSDHETRALLEKEVVKVGKALTGLVRFAEKHGAKIDQNDFDKAFAAISRSMVSAEKLARVSREMGRISSDSFRLDDVPDTETYIRDVIADPTIVRASALPGRTADQIDPDEKSKRRALGKMLGGRLTKAAKAALESGQAELPAVNPILVDDEDDYDLPPPVDDGPDDGVDFIDN